MLLVTGSRLQSVVSDVQVVVVKGSDVEVSLACGGVEMVEAGADVPAGATLDPALGDGPQIGKRYVDEELGIEVLCAKAGPGALTVDGRTLSIKGAKPLPSSD